MDELDLAVIKKRSVVGVIALTSRTFLLQIVNFVATFLLTIFLAPEVFGVFFVVSAAVNFLTYFSDIGLAAALIQKKEKLTNEDLYTTFTIQQCLVVTLVVVSLLISSSLANFYNLSTNGLWLFRALVVSFFLSSLKTIPSVLLERKLDFNRLVIPQIAETIFFNLVAVFLAWKGMGIASFTWAVIVRGVLGLGLIYLLQPWVPGFAFDKKSAKRLLTFGAPFQANSLMALLKDDLLTVFLGKILPFSQIGFIGWAQKWANTPLRFIMDSIIKVTFPAYSRLQDNQAALKAGLEKALFTVCFFAFPALIGLALLASPLVQMIPRYLKWQPALISLYLFCAQAIFASVSTVLTNVLNATGRIKISLGLMVVWTTATWVLTVVFVHFAGFNGVALGALVVSLTVFLPIIYVKRIVNFSLENVIRPLLGALIMGSILYFVLPILAINLTSLVLAILFGAIIYLGLMLVIARSKLAEARDILLGVIKK